MANLYPARKRRNAVWQVLAVAATLFGLSWLVLILGALLWNGVGCTTWEVVRSVVIPYTRVGVIGGIMLALGRALGETMAVTFIIGNSFRISSSIFAPGTTISAAIASEFAESDGLHQSGLILLGLLLFVLTFMVLAAARLMLMRLEMKAGK